MLQASSRWARVPVLVGMQSQAPRATAWASVMARCGVLGCLPHSSTTMSPQGRSVKALICASMKSASVTSTTASAAPAQLLTSCTAGTSHSIVSAVHLSRNTLRMVLWCNSGLCCLWNARVSVNTSSVPCMCPILPEFASKRYRGSARVSVLRRVSLMLSNLCVA